MPRLGSSRARMRPSRAVRSSGRDVQRQRRLPIEGLQDAPRGGAGRRGDRGGGPAAIARAGPEGNSVSPMRTVMSSGRSPKTSATVWATTVPTPVPISCTLDSASTEPSRITRTSQAESVCTLAPHSDCATPRPRLHRAGVGARRVAPAPADPLGADAPLLAPDGARIDAVAQRQRVDRQLLGQFVDRLFEPERARRVAGSAHRAARSGVDEDVVLRGFEVRAVVHRLGDIADARAQPDARGAVALQRNRRQRAVAPRADAQALPGRRAIAGIHLLFLAGPGSAAPAPGPGATARRRRARNSPSDDFEPKPPPMPSTTTRTRFSGRPNASASSRRTPAVNCVEM